MCETTICLTRTGARTYIVLPIIISHLKFMGGITLERPFTEVIFYGYDYKLHSNLINRQCG